MVREGARFKIVEEDASAASLELTQMSDEGRLLLQSGCATLPNSKEKAPLPDRDLTYSVPKESRSPCKSDTVRLRAL
jgi:hypothetical protein